MLRKGGCHQVIPWSLSGWPFRGLIVTVTYVTGLGADLKSVLWRLGGLQFLSLFPEQGYPQNPRRDCLHIAQPWAGG